MGKQALWGSGRGLGAMVLLASAGLACAEPPSSPPTTEDPPMHPAWRRTRLVIADADAARVEVVDVEYGESVGTIDLPSPVSRMGVGASGQHVLIAQDGEALLLYAGIAILDHSEGATDADHPHIHVYKFEPGLVGDPMRSAGWPFISAVGADFTATFPDAASAQPSILSIDEAALLEEPVPPPMSVPGVEGLVGPAHSFADGFLLEESSGVAHFQPLLGEGATLLTCSKVHARHVATDAALFACDDRVVAIDAEMLEPSELARAEGVRGVELHPDGPGALLLSSDAVRVAGDAEDAYDLTLPQGVRACEAVFEPGHASSVVVLGSDGVVHHLDATTGESLAQRRVVAPFECDEAIAPRLALAPARAYVTDPQGRAVVELWLDAGLRELSRHTLTVRPAAIVVAGVDFETRNLGDLSD